jgi:hypothetical protein
MEIQERIAELIDSYKVSRGRLKELEEITGISATTWGHIRAGGQKANQDHIAALGNAFPQYAYWVMTGKTDEAHGHTSPILERIRMDLQRAGRA